MPAAVGHGMYSWKQSSLHSVLEPAEPTIGLSAISHMPLPHMGALATLSVSARKSPPPKTFSPSEVRSRWDAHPVFGTPAPRAPCTGVARILRRKPSSRTSPDTLENCSRLAMLTWPELIPRIAAMKFLKTASAVLLPLCGASTSSTTVTSRAQLSPNPLQTPHSSTLPSSQQKPAASGIPLQPLPLMSAYTEEPSQTPWASSLPDSQQTPDLSSVALYELQQRPAASTVPDGQQLPCLSSRPLGQVASGTSQNCPPQPARQAHSPPRHSPRPWQSWPHEGHTSPVRQLTLWAAAGVWQR
mmetsp:Transcript_12586/g.29898  ORF Transcript_12586/g.29898 Transcript_12586/m.29898 type:complete len:300 (-) Transcript_12586:1270-2169(-)